MFGAIIEKYLLEQPTFKRIVSEEGAFTMASPSFDAMVANKKTGTLLVRASSLKLYAGWFATSVFSPGDFLTEPAVFA